MGVLICVYKKKNYKNKFNNVIVGIYFGASSDGWKLKLQKLITGVFINLVDKLSAP